MTALYVVLALVAGALAAAVAVRGYYRGRTETLEGDRAGALDAAAESEAGRVSVETQRNERIEADYAASTTEAESVQAPSAAVARWRAALSRLRRP